MRRRLLSLLLCSIVGISLVGCGGSEQKTLKSEDVDGTTVSIVEDEDGKNIVTDHGDSQETSEESSQEVSEETLQESSQETSKSSESNVESHTSETRTLVDNDIVTITYTGVNREGNLGSEINLSVQNKSDKEVNVKVSSLKVDGADVEAIFKIKVPQGDKAEGKLNLMKGDVDPNFKSVEGTFKITDKEKNSKEEAFSLNF